MREESRLQALIEAEKKADALFAAIEQAGLVAPGRLESAIDKDIKALAESDFGVTIHWHKRVIRTGINTLCIFSDTPPDRVVETDDIVFLDLGPVFSGPESSEWEADVGRSYALGPNPEKQRLCADLPRIFGEMRDHFLSRPDITGAELYAFAHQRAEAAGWLFGGAIAGHLVGEFPHARIPGDKEHYRISPKNPERMKIPDGNGRARYWILEVHLTDRDRQFGGFYERLLVP